MIRPIVEEMFSVCMILVELIAAAGLVGCFCLVVVTALIEIKTLIAKFKRVGGE